LSKRILITGAKGQLGLFLSYSLGKVFNVVSTSKNPENKDIIHMDVSSKKDVENILTKYYPEIIINCASFNDVDSCEIEKEYSRGVIFRGLQNILKYSDKNCNIIHISSDYVFDGFKRSYTEYDKPNPVNYYGKLKLEAENLLMSSNRCFSIFRCSTLFSHYIYNKSNFLAWVYNNLKSNKKINVVVDQVSNPTSVELISEVAQAVIMLNNYDIYNVGCLEPINRYNFAVKIANLFGFNSNLINSVDSKVINFKANRPKNTYLKTDKILNELNIDVYSIDYYLNRSKERVLDE
tara:strand:+ start:1689 stop:2567 length:879 start_codon:yes stop_codon:yes gene_type:complete